MSIRVSNRNMGNGAACTRSGPIGTVNKDRLSYSPFLRAMEVAAPKGTGLHKHSSTLFTSILKMEADYLSEMLRAHWPYCCISNHSTGLVSYVSMRSAKG